MSRSEDEKDTNEATKETGQDNKRTTTEDNEDTSSEDYEDTSIDDEYEEMSEKQKNVLKKFKLVLVINLKEVTKCQSLREVICRCNIFPDDEKKMAEDLLSYIIKNQKNVLLVFDGYDEYRCGRDSEIYEIFRGKKLRNCCVLITTRISKADDLREFKDVHAEITGFSSNDRKAFMERMLGDEREAKELNSHLNWKKLADLAKVPLLLVFFCTLWKKGKLKSFPENKTKLYLMIVQYVLDYSQGKRSPAHFGKVQDFKEILAEIGKVALECLLNDDHVFEYDQLSAAILCEESVIIGLLQVTEYAENLRPAGMVSFIHKSIQEFLAAWYIAYRCVPEGSLGGLEQHASTLEDFETMGNVFHFICGLSDDGAVKVFQHLKSIRMSDPTLDLSKTIPDEETDSGVPLGDVTDRHERFSDLVCDFFQEGRLKAEFLTCCFDCTGGIVPLTERTVELLNIASTNDLTQSTYPGVFLYAANLSNNFLFLLNETTIPTLYKLIEVLQCVQASLRIAEGSEVLTVGRDFVMKFQNACFFGKCTCSCVCILGSRNGQFQFYLTDMELGCDDHAGLFTDSTPSLFTSLYSKQSCLKFLRSLKCLDGLSDKTVKALGGIIRNCNHLNWIEVQKSDDSLCDLLKQVPNPSKCSLMIESHLSSPRAVNFASLIPKFNNIIALNLSLRHCCAAALDTLVTNITHKTLEGLSLREISLTLTAAVVLGRSLPEMSSLKVLQLKGIDGSILHAEEMEALFGGFNKTMPLCELSFNGFSVKDCLAPLTKSFRFFPNLRYLVLLHLNIDENDCCSLLESSGFIPNLRALSVWCEHKAQAHFYTTTELITPWRFRSGIHVQLDGISLTPVFATTLGQLLPAMSSLQEFKLTGVDGSILTAKEMEALFGGLNKTSLNKLTFSGFSVTGCLTPLTKRFRFFPNLRELKLEKLNMDERDQCGLLENLRFIRNLTALSVQENHEGDTHCYTTELNAFGVHETLLNLRVEGISLTPAAATALGQSLAEMSYLTTVELIGMDGNNLQDKEMEALFGGLKEKTSLNKLIFSGFSVTGCLSPLTKRFRFFPNLRELKLEKLNIDERDQCSLLENLRFICNLTALSVQEKDEVDTHCYTTELNAFGFRGRFLNLKGISLTPAAARALGQSLSEMPFLTTVKLIGMDGSILQDKEINLLFGGFNKILPCLCELIFSGFSVKGCLAPLTTNFRFFPNLKKLKLDTLNMDEHDQCSILENIRFICNLTSLTVRRITPFHADGCTVELDTYELSNSKILILSGISLTPATATALGRSLPEMSSLQELEIFSGYGTILKTEEMEALFGKFSKAMPLRELTVSGFHNDFYVKGSLAPLTKSFRFFPELRVLHLRGFSMDERNLCDLLESSRFIPNLEILSVQGEAYHFHLPTVKAETVSIFTRRTRQQLNLHEISLTPAAAAAPGQSLPEMFCTGEVNPASSFTLGTLKQLELAGISLTPAAAVALGRSLSEMPFLQELKVTGVYKSIWQVEEMASVGLGRSLAEMSSLPAVKFTEVYGSILQAEEMEALFGVFDKAMPLCKLTFSDFSVKGCFAALIKSFCFFPHLRDLNLERLEIDERDVCCLLENSSSIPNFVVLRVRCKHEIGARFSLTECDDTPGVHVHLSGVRLTPLVAMALGRSLPGMSSLQVLELTGADGSILQTKEMEALFGRFNKTLPSLRKLIFRGFSVRGCLVPLVSSFRYFPNLKTLKLEKLNMDKHDQFALLENLRLFRDLTELRAWCKPLGQADCCTVNLTSYSNVYSSAPKNCKALLLNGISLTPEAAVALGRSIPEMLSLNTLELTGEQNESILQAEEIEALFGVFKARLPLYNLIFSGFSVKGCIASLTKSLCFFPDLRVLHLAGFNMDEHNFCALLKSLRFVPTLKTLRVEGKAQDYVHFCTAEVDTVISFTLRTLEKLILEGISLTPAAAAAVGRSLPEMSSLEELVLIGRDGSILQAEEMEALFGDLNKPMPLLELTFIGFSVRGCLASLIRSLRFFPNLTQLNLKALNMDEHDLCGLLESFQFIPNLWALSLSGNPLGHAVTSIVPHVTNLLKLQWLSINHTSHSEEDLNYVRETVQRALPELKVFGSAMS